jgi:CubicO group peptidase (beta-lactamase class C family)
LTEAIAGKAFPGAACAVANNGKLALFEAGRFTYEPSATAVAASTVFDLASLTKVLATTSAAMLLFERGKFHLEQPVTDICPEFGGSDPRRSKVTLRMLLAHSSGLPAHRKLWKVAETRQNAIAATLTTPLVSDPLQRAEYSDIGFIILGEAIQRITGEPLAEFCRREIFAPLQMSSTLFNPPENAHADIPPTLAQDTYRKRLIQAEVNDENAALLGGTAGHAGLFGTAHDVARFAECVLQGGAPLWKPETVALFAQRQTQPAGTTRALGWDTPSAPSQSGKHFSSASIGHLGYTGSSLWIDRERQISVTLLTNRTWPDDSSQLIKKVRPAFHDAVFADIAEGS